MIKTIELRNFQSHKDTELTLDSGVNVIVGPSDSGKTAIIRALRKLVWNRPLGDAFRSHWGGHTHIKVVTDDEHTVEWFTDSGGMGYRMDTKTAFKAVGTSVPDEITKALNLNDINLQQQLDQPFLLTNSPGEVAQHFNRIANLDQIDTGLHNVQKWLRSIEQDMSSAQRRKEKLTEDLQQFDHLDKFEAEVEVLERMEQDMISAINRKRDLTQLHTNIQDVEYRIQVNLKRTEASSLVDGILGHYTHKRAVQERYDVLRAILKDIYNTREDIEAQEDILQDETLVNSTLAWITTRKTLNKGLQNLVNLLNEIEDVSTEMGENLNTANQLHKTYEKEFPDVCPLCNQPVKK